MAKLLTLMQVIELSKINICSKCRTICRQCPWTGEETVKTLQAQQDEIEAESEKEEERKSGLLNNPYKDPCPE